MAIEPDRIYGHAEHDEILVLDVLRRYESYDTDGDTGRKTGVFVRYVFDWDGYGAMPGATFVDPIVPFSTTVGEERRRYSHDSGAGS